MTESLGLSGNDEANAIGSAGVISESASDRKTVVIERTAGVDSPVPSNTEQDVNPKQVKTKALAKSDIAQPIADLSNVGALPSDSTEGTATNTFAQAVQDFVVPTPGLKEESEQFFQVALELVGKNIVTDIDARAAIDRLAHSLTIKTASRELTELSPRIGALVKTNTNLLQDFIELCRIGEQERISAEALTKIFEQLNRLYDAPVLPARRDLAVEHFISAAAAATNLDGGIILNKLQLCEHILLSNYPDRAAELLLSILTSTRVNTEELAVRAFKFDRGRVKNTVRVMRDALEPEAAMRHRENIHKQNYFSHLFSSIAINAALQASNPKSRYARKRGRSSIYQVEEQEVKPGVYKVVSSGMQEFVGLSYDEMAWINRQFAGQRLRGHLPERLSY